MTREEAIKAAQDEYERLRAQEAKNLRAREDEAVRKDPEIRVLLSKRALLPVQTLRLCMENKSRAREIADAMRDEGIRLNGEIRMRLSENGFPEDYLQMHYACRTCRDTGYTADIPQKMCECFQKKLRELQRETDVVSDFETQNFEAFDAARIPEEIVYGEVTQRALTERVRELCEEYADAYPETYKPNLLITGEAGLGKTFLLSCMAERIEKRGHPVTLISAYRLLEIMRSKHFHMDAQDTDFDSLLTCPILMIDDLGCEPMLKNITQEYLFVLLNERIVKKRHTVVATNMTPPQIKERYGERIMSRLCDTGVSDSVRLMGKDLRRV